jgi:Xaa-Pro aminopeptidase
MSEATVRTPARTAVVLPDLPTEGLAALRAARLADRLADAPFEAVISLSGPAVDYATGYRSVSAAVHGVSGLAALTSAMGTAVAGPVADAAPAFDAGVPEDRYAAYGRFFFESEGGRARATQLVEQHAGLAAALAALVTEAGLANATIGLERAAATSDVTQALRTALPGVLWRDASAWLGSVRSRKLPGELDLLTRSAQSVERGIAAAIAAARPGTSERALARAVAVAMAEDGLEPRFVVVTSGPRSALADAYPTDRAIERGDLVRFDVGGTLDGYWSDIGRTAVVGDPSPKQARLYEAILAGEEAELALARPGVAARDVFARAVEVVQARGGPDPYRRQHAGHGIGLTAYEAPIIRPDDPGTLEAGMTFCFETPYYELGWGGMMVEDLLVVTEDGCRRLTSLVRDLTVIPG